MKLTDKRPAATQRVLVYGGPKAGKTQLVAQLAEKFKLIWFDLERGHTTLFKLPQEWQANIDLIDIPDSSAYPIAAETCLKVVKGKPVSICEAHGKVTCMLCKKAEAPATEVNFSEVAPDTIVVFDSLTQFTSSTIANITKNQPEDYKLDFDDYTRLKHLVEKFLSQIQAANCNVVCISHEEEVEMEGGRKKLVPVSGSSKSSRNTARYFDTVIYCEIKAKKHIAASGTTYATNILTGSRSEVVLEDGSGSLMSIFEGVIKAQPVTKSLIASKAASTVAKDTPKDTPKDTTNTTAVSTGTAAARRSKLLEQLRSK